MAPLGKPKRKVYEAPPISIPKEMPVSPRPSPRPRKVPVGAQKRGG